MNESSVISALTTRYPGRRFISLPEDGPVKQIICETDPANSHPDHSSVVAVIDRMPPHRNTGSLSLYRVLAGRLNLNVEGVDVSLSEGESFAVPSRTIHSAIGDSTWVQIDFTPGWSAREHVFVPEDI